MEKYNTLKAYNDNAEDYFEQTINGDMKNLCDRFLTYLPKSAYILDFGCGSGRDSKYFIERGYRVKAIDGSSKLCNLASKYIGQQVQCMRFEELSDDSVYDGIWACSSIIHVERPMLPDVLARMIRATKENGIIFASFKKGNEEMVQSGKYFNYITRDMFESLLGQVSSKSELVDYFENDTCAGVNRPLVTWGNYLVRVRKK